MTAKTELELERRLPLLEEAEVLEDDDDKEELYYFYDDDNNYLELRHQRGDMPNKENSDLKRYLTDLLVWYYRGQEVVVYEEFNFYQTADPQEKPLYPDIAILKNQLHREGTSSYQIGVTGPAPDVTIELISKKTRQIDLKKKPIRYAAWGVKEYFVYDPRPRKRINKTPRLWGWRLPINGNRFEVLEPGANGWIWSEQLDSWLGPDGINLRLYDGEKNVRLTEAQTLQREADNLQLEVAQLREKLRRFESNQ